MYQNVPVEIKPKLALQSERGLSLKYSITFLVVSSKELVKEWRKEMWRRAVFLRQGLVY